MTSQEFRQIILRDKKALRKGSPGFLKEFFFPNVIEQFEYLLRKYEYMSSKTNKNLIDKIRLMVLKIKFRKQSLLLGFSIPINTFGPGLSIAHYGTIVVNGAARVGKNCRLHVGVNIGASNGSEKAPRIGDNVYIGPGVIIYGDIDIADNITIGANSTVNKSCLVKNCVLAGNPAKIVKENFPVWWETQKLEL